MAVMHGEPISRPGRRPLIPNLDQRIAAAQWLADRGWGKAKEIIELASEASPEQRIELLRRLSPQDRDQLRTILAKVLNSTTVPVSDATDGAPALAPPLEKSDSDLPPPDTVT
jgi:hypothetical protein